MWWVGRRARRCDVEGVPDALAGYAATDPVLPPSRPLNRQCSFLPSFILSSTALNDAALNTRHHHPSPPALPPCLQACSLVGGTINVLRVPERWLQPADPLKAAPLDYFFNSHQVGCCGHSSSSLAQRRSETLCM